MEVSRTFRIWSGRRITERGSDSNSSTYTDLQRFGFYWIMPLIVSLERCPSITPPHPSGAPWRFEFRIDYRKGESTPPTAAALRILPNLRRNFCITLPLDPAKKLTLADLEYCIKQYTL